MWRGDARDGLIGSDFRCGGWGWRAVPGGRPGRSRRLGARRGPRAATWGRPYPGIGVAVGRVTGQDALEAVDPADPPGCSIGKGLTIGTSRRGDPSLAFGMTGERRGGRARSWRRGRGRARLPTVAARWGETCGAGTAAALRGMLIGRSLGAAVVAGRSPLLQTRLPSGVILSTRPARGWCGVRARRRPTIPAWIQRRGAAASPGGAGSHRRFWSASRLDSGRGGRAASPGGAGSHRRPAGASRLDSGRGGWPGGRAGPAPTGDWPGRHSADLGRDRRAEPRRAELGCHRRALPLLRAPPGARCHCCAQWRATEMGLGCGRLGGAVGWRGIGRKVAQTCKDRHKCGIIRVPARAGISMHA